MQGSVAAAFDFQRSLIAHRLWNRRMMSPVELIDRDKFGPDERRFCLQISILAGKEVLSDPRDKFFELVATARVTARVVAEEPGIVAGAGAVPASLAEIGMTAKIQLADGTLVKAGTVITEIVGSPKEIALAEERLIGLMAKPSGIATATARFVARAGGRMRVVSGAWKKLPFSQKEMIRQAIVVGGAAPRIAEWPFLYIDKNFVRMHGGLEETMAAAGRFEAGPRSCRSVANTVISAKRL